MAPEKDGRKNFTLKGQGTGTTPKPPDIITMMSNGEGIQPCM
jgi:hypothetical protein